MKRITISKKRLNEIINEGLRSTISEGVDFDEATWTVSYNSNHEDNVETSEVTNPTMVSKYGNNVEVWSIFKRKSGAVDDGNPLVYALKGEGGWHFKSNKDKNAIFSQMEKITKKFFETHSSHVTVILPSDGALNSLFANIIKQYNGNSIFIDDLLIKMSVEEVRRIILEPNSPFRKVFNTPNLFRRAIAEFDMYTSKMGDKYRTHLMRNRDIRTVVEQTIRIDYPQVAKYFDNINGKDVLFVDDNIGRGSSIRISTRELQRYFTPNSITFLTLFSEKYDKYGKEIRHKKTNYNDIRRRLIGK